ncbi:ESPR domain-containing protein [Haemophilus haemolyticus]|uniref:ESPR domain-containing protein n=1 Tax=Haemophilus haemolyticus TaxID=726 RepID=UPI000E56F6D3|nr:ESPR domain-containing protein [Haemophilus haemolyticus]
MNNIFKVIWHHATQTWMAVSELASTKGKSKSIKLAAISTALWVISGGTQAVTYIAADGLIAVSYNPPATTPPLRK